MDEWKLRIAKAQKCSSSRYAKKVARATDELRRNTTAREVWGGEGNGSKQTVTRNLIHASVRLPELSAQ